MRKTKITCTIGPASESEEMPGKMIQAGMDVARFNFSHGTHEEHKVKLQRLRKVSEEMKLPIAALMDTKGPEIRLRDFENGSAMLEAGQLFTLTTEELMGTRERASISYKNLHRDISVGTTILIDDGNIEMTVEEMTDTDIICRVVNGGKVSNHKGVNVPGAILSMPYISDVDKQDILFAIENEYDYIAASFVRCKEDVLQIRQILKDHESKMKIIAKIENMQGIQNIDEIIEASDGIMVARGDMGVEIPIEEVPVLQKELIKKAVARGKHVITATQMLESMIRNPRPTRAEATDIANAIYDGTTAIMLSGESAAGQYPIEAVQTMSRIAERTEKDIDYATRMKKMDCLDRADVTTAISHACCTTAMDLNAAAIITVTMSGFTASMISRYKPNCTIIGCSVYPRVCRQLNLVWGVVPVKVEEKETTMALFDEAARAALDQGLVQKGDTVVVTAGGPLGTQGKTNMIRVIEL